MLFHLHDLCKLIEEPAIDVGDVINFIDCHPAKHRIANVPYPVGIWLREFSHDLAVVRSAIGKPKVFAICTKAKGSNLEPSKRFLE